MSADSAAFPDSPSQHPRINRGQTRPFRAVSDIKGYKKQMLDCDEKQIVCPDVIMVAIVPNA
jgi:hypothetical protein